MVNLTINGKAVSVKEGTTILEAAKTIGETIPTLCYLKEVNAIGACRVCVVEVEGTDRCVTACNNFVEEGMVVYTNSRKVRTTRKTNVKLILSQHDYKCGTCIRSGNCALQSIANELNISEMPYDSILEKDNWDKTFPLIRDAQKCIKCMRCVQVCDNIQGMHIWDVVNTGSRTTVNVRANKNIAETACTLCGQCVSNCPVGALTERDDVGIVLDAIENEDIITVVQIAPAVRTAWGEDFGMSKEYATAQRLVAGLRRIGFDYIFDTTFAADMTIMEEGSEFLERLPEIKESGLPMFTSCCPGWVKFVKSEFPEMAGRLSTAKSPQQMFGAITKSYYAEKLGVDPEKIFCVSIMPCLAKKDECTWDGGKDVDAVLTTREVERMFKAFFIKPEELDEDEVDNPLGEGTGAGVIFGATGGRVDHLLGNIQSLGYILSCGGEGMIAADREIIRLYRAGSYRIYDREGFSFSLVAYTDKVEGLTIKGAKYEVEDCLLTNVFPLGISNVVKGFDGQDRKYAEISFKSGYLLSVQSKMVTDF